MGEGLLHNFLRRSASGRTAQTEISLAISETKDLGGGIVNSFAKRRWTRTEADGGEGEIRAIY